MWYVWQENKDDPTIVKLFVKCQNGFKSIGFKMCNWHQNCITWHLALTWAVGTCKGLVVFAGAWGGVPSDWPAITDLFWVWPPGCKSPVAPSVGWKIWASYKKKKKKRNQSQFEFITIKDDTQDSHADHFVTYYGRIKIFMSCPLQVHSPPNSGSHPSLWETADWTWQIVRIKNMQIHFVSPKDMNWQSILGLKEFNTVQIN